MGFLKFVQVILIFLTSGGYLSFSVGENYDFLPPKMPTIGISMLVRNKAHTLPYFLSSLWEQSYPKDRMYLRFYCDHTSDNSLEILETWLEEFGSLYHATYIVADESSPVLYEDETTTVLWSAKRFEHVISLREDALEFARNHWADYLFMLDADVFLTEQDTLRILVEQRLAVVAPMLQSEGTYSNFWCAIHEEFYYSRCEDYYSILDRDEGFVDCHAVPMVHTAVLISMQFEASDRLTYVPDKAQGYSGPEDDTVVFAHNAASMGIPLHVCNTHVFGYVPKPPLSSSKVNSDALERDSLLNIKLLAIGRGTPLPLMPELQKYVTYPQKDTLDCSKIFMINLERRVERRKLMELSFQELGMEVETVKAVNGRTLNPEDLRELNVRLMPEYEDPYHKRPIKAGEIGCFLSHYNVWNKIVENGYELSMILEDDVRFVPYFRLRFSGLLREVSGHDYDLLYLGRKILLDSAERPVTAHTTKPLYSYWTLGYLLTLRGARKLLEANPLQNVLPVDEYLPIMFDQHPNETWKSHFPRRNLRALSASPLLVHPTHYTGMPGYLSDTEDSPVVRTDLDATRSDL
ncbi:glycosyltransferase 25 family member [Maniola jurtina]|uniref:glycosyltransferase 25 family member n=1 Tax=Maniola jurtina TaxID=191418 RepID=UPI001E6890DE|nr:glycosyltransferase 25 family member [Maniola jurtina]